MKTAKYGLFLAILWFSACRPPVTAPAPAPIQETSSAILPLDSAVVSGTLENGLTYFIRRNEKPENRVELRLAVNAGSILEDNDQQGLAHLTEHMAFNGTTHFPKQKLVDYLERIGMRFGADVNAYTSFDETVYMLEVPTEEASYIDTGFQVLRDWAGELLFEPEEVDKERGVVKEEWRLGRGANARMRDIELPVILKGSRYAERLPIGKPAIIDTAHYETLRRFYRDWYRPDLMAVIAVGSIEPRKIETLIRDRFSDLQNPAEERKRVFYPVPDHEATLAVTATDKEAQYTSVTLMVKQAPRDQRLRETYEYQLRTQLFSSMLNARLDELRQQADPPFLYSYVTASSLVRTKDAIQIGAIVNEDGVRRGLETLIREAERVRRFGFTDTEFERAKTRIIRSYEQSLKEREKTKSRSLASELIRHFLTDEPAPGIAYETQLVMDYFATLDLEEINTLAEDLFHRKNTVISVDGPEKENLVYPTDQELIALRDQVTGEELTPYRDQVSSAPLVTDTPAPGKVVEETRIEALNLIRWKLSNGITVYAKPTDFKNDQILFNAFSPGGNSLVPDNQYLNARYAPDLVMAGGVGNYSQIQLKKKLAGKVVSVSPYIGELWEGFRGSSSQEDLETLFQLIWLYGTQPRKDSTAFLSYRQRQESFLKNRSARPESAFSDSVRALVSGHHFRSRPMTAEDVEHLNLDESIRIYRDRFADFSDFTFVFVGSFDPAVLRSEVEQWLAVLPGRNREETWRDVGRYIPEGVITTDVYRGSEPKSMTAIIFPGAVSWTPEEQYIASSLAQALGIKLREVIREDESGTYGISIYSTLNRFPHDDARLNVFFGADPARIDTLVSNVLVQLDSVRTFGLPEKYLEKIKETQRREFEVNRKENRFWLNQITFNLKNGLELQEILAVPERIDALSMDDLRQMARKLITEERRLRVTLYPEKSGTGKK
ncbi:MAG: M16 family metallopeptidase [Fidelibacterota bacterium]